MKFSFDSEGYRNNLASELREQRATDKEGARQILEEERATLQYKVAEDIKKVKQKIKEKHEEKGLEIPPFTPNPEKTTLEEVRLEGSDGIEHLLEVQTIDISDQIPDEIKLVYDIYRLGILDRKLNHLDVGPGIFTEPLTRDEIQLESRALGQIQSYLFEWYLKTRSGVELGDEDSEDSRDFQRKLHFSIKNKYAQLLDSITNGAYSDTNVFCHVLGGDIYDLRDSEVKRTARVNRYPNESIDGIPVENVFDFWNAETNSLWVTHGGNVYTNNLFKPVILIDSKNERLGAEVKSIDFLYPEQLDRFQDRYSRIMKEKNIPMREGTMSDKINALLQSLHPGVEDQVGAKFVFTKKVPMLFVSDQIVDAYHGRLIRVREKDASEELTILEPLP